MINNMYLSEDLEKILHKQEGLSKIKFELAGEL